MEVDVNKWFSAFTLLGFSVSAALAQDGSDSPINPTLADATLRGDCVLERQPDDRVTFCTTRDDEGKLTPTTAQISVDTVIKFCGDSDGCSVRIGMYNSNGTGRTKSREGVLHLNPDNRAWQSYSANRVGKNVPVDRQGADYNGFREDVIWVDDCYFSDTLFEKFVAKPDGAFGFSLYDAKPYDNGCVLTMID